MLMEICKLKNWRLVQRQRFDQRICREVISRFKKHIEKAFYTQIVA